MRVYVVSYGGSGSWLLVDYLRTLGVEARHIHSRKSPKNICNTRKRKEIYNLHLKRGWDVPKEEEWFDYKNLIKEGKIIFIYRNPIYSLLSKKSGNLYHFENLDISPEQHQILVNLGFTYEGKYHQEALKKYLHLKKDPLNYKEFFDNYHNCKWNKDYDILSVNFDHLWDNISKICEFVGKEYNGKFPQKQKREYDQNIISLSNKVFNKINSAIDASNNIKILNKKS